MNNLKAVLLALTAFFYSTGKHCTENIRSCPLGSYCPLAKLNETTAYINTNVRETNKKICSYRYQLPPGQTNHSCGGADIWADIVSSSEANISLDPLGVHSNISAGLVLHHRQIKGNLCRHLELSVEV
ncbi:hypothetical protein CsSME_00040706 [Camellia sinensis var. sinensis]